MSKTRAVYLLTFLLWAFSMLSSHATVSSIMISFLHAFQNKQRSGMRLVTEQSIGTVVHGFAFGEFFDVAQNFRTIVRMESGGDCLVDVLKDVVVAPGFPVQGRLSND